MIYFTTKADINNLLATHRDEVIAALKDIYDTPDDTAYRIVSGSEDTGDVVYEEIATPNPLWKLKGFLSRAEIKEIIGDYSDDNLNAAIAWKLQAHLDHIAKSAANYELKIAQEAVQEAKMQAFLDNLPPWTQVSTAVDNIGNLADAKVFLKKLARVVYWLARNQAD